MKVELGQMFDAWLDRHAKYNAEEADIIVDFILHLKNEGFKNLPGRNKPSTDLNPYHWNYESDKKFVRDHNLWHYHIGIPRYNTIKRNDQTSEYILHYSLNGSNVKILLMNRHPPFRLPDESELR